jgi:4-amino-4-deoxy-L-arabinose transferase-like glycosyltransferase
VLAAWAITRAIADGATKWLLWCGTFIGFAFLAKMMQAFLVVPGFGVAYLIAGPHGVAKRLWQLCAALGAMIVAGGWWVAIAMLWPTADRPFIGGSQTNSVWDLMFGYNGIGRLTGDETGSVGWSDQSSATKLFDSQMGGQVAWLLPAAVLAAVAVLVLRGRSPRTDQTRAAVLVWGSWLLVTGITFSLMEGIIHPYYTVALAPAIAALVGIGAATMWRHRTSPIALGALTGTVAVTGVWAKVLLDRSTGYHPWLGVAVLVTGMAGAVLLGVAAVLPRHRTAAAVVAVVLSLFAILGGPVAYTLTTVSTGHTGALPSAGPSMPGAGFGGGRNAGFGGGARPNVGAGTAPSGVAGGGRPGGGTGGPGAGTGGPGGLLGAPTVSAEMVTLLKTNSSGFTWAAAVSGSNNAAGYQLATGLPVMPIGGFNGTDPAPTLAQFQQLVQHRTIHYYIAGTLTSSSSGSDAAHEIATWVAEHFAATTVGSQTVYDLSSGSS